MQAVCLASACGIREGVQLRIQAAQLCNMLATLLANNNGNKEGMKVFGGESSVLLCRFQLPPHQNGVTSPTWQQRFSFDATQDFAVGVAKCPIEWKSMGWMKPADQSPRLQLLSQCSIPVAQKGRAAIPFARVGCNIGVPACRQAANGRGVAVAQGCSSSEAAL